MELVSVTSTQIADVSNSFVSFHSDLQLQFKNLLLLSCVHTFIAKVVACLLLQGIIEVLGNLYLKCSDLRELIVTATDLILLITVLCKEKVLVYLAETMIYCKHFDSNVCFVTSVVD